MKSKYIKIEGSEVRRNLLLSDISCSENIEKYFGRKRFWAKYDVDIEGIDVSILNIPVLSSVITVAWASGADIYVEELDRSYFKSLNAIKFTFKRWYPKFPFSTRIHIKKMVSNEFSHRKLALLFSGGVDSLTSYIWHKREKPNLIMIWGTDVPINQEKFWKNVKNEYETFAKREGVEINFVQTNLRRFINERPLNVEFGRFLVGGWWGGFQHGISSLSIYAPLTVVKKIGTLLIASTHSPQYKYPWGSHWLIDNKVRWANTRVIHDSYKLTRHEKIKNILKSYLKEGKVRLRVCYSQFQKLNCGRCEKCCRTITSPVLENIDPNKCGFNIGPEFFAFLKEQLIKNPDKFFHSPNEVFMWKDIQHHVPRVLNHNLLNCRWFFDWFLV
ncbi:MAG: hypothetical protein ACTSVW_00170 [Candidatus Njordarchaeales archaeon]